MPKMSGPISAAADVAAKEQARREAPEASPLPAVWPGQTRTRIALWDEFPEEATGAYGARKGRLKAVDAATD